MTRTRVLLADDNKAIRDILNFTLAEHFDVIQAVSDGGADIGGSKAIIAGHSGSGHFRCRF